MQEEKIRELIGHYLANQIDRAAFSQSFAGLYFQVRNNRDASSEARRFCNAVVLPFAELSRGDRTEQSFREELAKTVRPFAVILSYRTAQPAQEFTFFDAPERIGPKPQFGTDLRGRKRHSVAYG
jgi:hypothetical protein